MPLRIEQLDPTPPWTIRARVWGSEVSGQVAQLATALQRLAPIQGNANVAFGWDPSDQAYVTSLGGQIAHSSLPELLERCRSDNIQLAWSDPAGERALEVICELYDNHFEVQARSPLAPAVEQALKGLDRGATYPAHAADEGALCLGSRRAPY